MKNNPPCSIIFRFKDHRDFEWLFWIEYCVELKWRNTLIPDAINFRFHERRTAHFLWNILLIVPSFISFEWPNKERKFAVDCNFRPGMNFTWRWFLKNSENSQVGPPLWLWIQQSYSDGLGKQEYYCNFQWLFGDVWGMLTSGKIQHHFMSVWHVNMVVSMVVWSWPFAGV